MRIRSFWAVAAIGLLTFAIGGAAQAQDWGGGGPGGWGGGGPGGWGGGFSRRSPEETLQRVDANHNGIIEPEEIENDFRARYYMPNMLRDAGLDPTKPIPIDKIKPVLEARYAGRMSPPGTTPPGSTTPAPATPGVTDHSKDKDKKKEKDKAAAAPAPLVPGFVATNDLPKLPAFGEPLAMATGPAPPPAEVIKDPKLEKLKPDDSDEKIRRYAESLLRQYDENKDGILQKEEWSKMRGEPEKADTNKDGLVTLDELFERLKKLTHEGDRKDERRDDRRPDGSQGGGPPGWGGGPPGGGPGGGWGRDNRDPRADSKDPRSDSKDPRKGGSTSSSTGKTAGKRLLTATERLPDGLPSWFARADADGDGQITMAEFSATWNDSKVSEFLKYDLNGDGVITPNEVLKVEKASPKK